MEGETRRVQLNAVWNIKVVQGDNRVVCTGVRFTHRVLLMILKVGLCVICEQSEHKMANRAFKTFFFSSQTLEPNFISYWNSSRI